MAEENYMNQGPEVSPQAEATGEQNKPQQTGSGVAHQGRNVGTGGTQPTTKKLTPAPRVTGREVLDDAKERLRTFKQDTDEYVRKNPAKAVFAALAIGFVLGMMRRR